ncbi:MAG: PAS domain S-box protein, partial [Candidatus Zixiibacteriota bacterium]
MAVRPKKSDAREELKSVFVRTLLDTANSLIICLDKEASLLVFNAECERVTGYKNQEVIGKSWPKLFLPEDHHHCRRDNFAEWARENPRDTYEGPIKTRSGEIRTILWSNSVIFYPDTDELIAIAVGQDITKRKLAEKALKEALDLMEKRVQERTAELLAANRKLKEQIESRIIAEEALRESERRYEMATSAGKVGVWDWNLETNDIYVDPNMKATLGYKDREIRNHLNDWGKLV